jgi:hypothetical protein
MGFGFTAISLERGTMALGDGQHGDVLAEGMDVKDADFFVSGMHHGTLEQPVSKTHAARSLAHRDPKLGTRLPLFWPFDGQVSQSNDAQRRIENGIDVIALEIHAFDIAGDLLIGGGISKAQHPIIAVQLKQVGQNAGPMPFIEADDGDQHFGIGRLQSQRSRRLRPPSPQAVAGGLKKLEPKFHGVRRVCADNKGYPCEWVESELYFSNG